MSIFNKQIETLDWQLITDHLNEKGYAIVPKFLSNEHCQDLVGKYNKEELYRKTVIMERHRFGRGEYKYYDYPLPDIIQDLRAGLYPKLATIANLWMKILKIGTRFPDSLKALQDHCHANGQLKPTPLILKYQQGGFNTLHQDLYGDVYFPLQAVFMLNNPNDDFMGGELVLTEQVPRAQSKAMVLSPQRGDMVVLTTHFRPVQGSKGYYRANMRHGVSELHDGTRHTMGIIFHDAVS